MKLKFVYSKSFELTRVKDTLKRHDWFMSQGYNIKLPEGITKDSTDKELRAQIKKEYNEGKFQKEVVKISKKFSKYAEVFSNKLKEVFKKGVPKTVTVYLTIYGVGGSYLQPAKVIFNIAHNYDGAKTIAHEIIHLMIEDSIQKYGIRHWEKERIVDLILNSKEFKFLNYNSWQSDYDGAEDKIDPVFNQFFFSNMERFFQTIQH
jgi:hypothetical protein